MKLEFDKSRVIQDHRDLVVGNRYWEVGQGGSQEIRDEPLAIGKYIGPCTENPRMLNFELDTLSPVDFNMYNGEPNNYNNHYLCPTYEDAVWTTFAMKEAWTEEHTKDRQEYMKFMANIFPEIS